MPAGDYDPAVGFPGLWQVNLHEAVEWPAEQQAAAGGVKQRSRICGGHLVA